jgi:hypothetical protein
MAVRAELVVVHHAAVNEHAAQRELGPAPPAVIMPAALRASVAMQRTNPPVITPDNAARDLARYVKFP